MDTKYDFKITTEYEVIGSGGMITRPCQIGEWWVMPLQNYKGRIPADIQLKLNQFLSQGVEIQGLLIAEDMKEVEVRRSLDKQKKKEVVEKAMRAGIGRIGTVLNFLGNVLYYTFMGVLYAIAGVLFVIDPMLIAVMPSGEWICLGSWYE